jgi:hypothetical protein
MAAQQTQLTENHTGQTIRKYIELLITTTTVANSTFSAYTAFTRAFSAAPRVIGVNSADPQGHPSAASSAAGITIYVHGAIAANLPDGTVLVSATVEGELA